MIWTGALIVFIVQIVCCIYVENKLFKYLPTAIPAALAIAAFFGTGSVFTVLWLAMFGGSALLGLLAIALYQLAK